MRQTDGIAKQLVCFFKVKVAATIGDTPPSSFTVIKKEFIEYLTQQADVLVCNDYVTKDIENVLLFRTSDYVSKEYEISKRLNGILKRLVGKQSGACKLYDNHFTVNLQSAIFAPFINGKNADLAPAEGFEPQCFDPFAPNFYEDTKPHNESRKEMMEKIIMDSMQAMTDYQKLWYARNMEQQDQLRYVRNWHYAMLSKMNIYFRKGEDILTEQIGISEEIIRLDDDILQTQVAITKLKEKMIHRKTAGGQTDGIELEIKDHESWIDTQKNKRDIFIQNLREIGLLTPAEDISVEAPQCNLELKKLKKMLRDDEKHIDDYGATIHQLDAALMELNTQHDNF